MALNFGSSANPQTTARELANELGSYAASLRTTAQELGAEIQKIQTAQNELKEEYKATALTFIKSTLSDLNGDGFESFSKLAQSSSAIGGQSLTYARQKLLDARESALKDVNEHLDSVVDVDGFLAVKATASAEKKTAGDAVTAAESVLDTVKAQQKAWTKTDGYKFVQLEKTVTANGAPALTPENRSYYEPTNLLSAFTNHVTRSESYKAVRKALVEYDNGENGKDIFADMASHRNTADGYETQTKAAKQDIADAQAAYEKANAKLQSFASNADDIRTDDQILELLQKNAAGYLEIPEFMQAVAEHYAEDFPSALPLLAAKQATMVKLIENAGKKQAEVMELYQNVAKQQRTAEKYSPSTKLPVDLDAVRAQNQKGREHYDNYTRATRDSYNRTRTYTPSRDVVYVNQGPSFLEYMIWDNILHSHDRHDTVYINNGSTPVPTLSPYSADLLGVNKDNAASYNLNLPDNVFDALPANNNGFDFGTQSDVLDRQIESAFDTIESQAPSQSSGYSSRQTSDYTRNDRDETSYRAPEPTSFGSSGRT